MKVKLYYLFCSGISEGNCDYFMLILSENPSSTLLTKHNKAKSSTDVTLKLRSLWFQVGNITFLTIQICIGQTGLISLRNQQVGSSSLLITYHR